MEEAALTDYDAQVYLAHLAHDPPLLDWFWGAELGSLYFFPSPPTADHEEDTVLPRLDVNSEADAEAEEVVKPPPKRLRLPAPIAAQQAKTLKRFLARKPLFRSRTGPLFLNRSHHARRRPRCKGKFLPAVAVNS